MSHYIMTTRILNGIAETQIDPAALPCQRIAAKVPQTRRDYISKTDHTKPETHDTESELKQEIIKRFGLDFAQLVARSDDDMAAIADDSAMYR